MRIFACPACRDIAYYDDLECRACGSALAFDRAERTLVVADQRHVRCANDLHGCNWTITGDDTKCFACRLTRTRPNEGTEAGLDLLRRTIAAKRWLLFGLDELRLPVVSHRDRADGGLAFDLDVSTDDHQVLIGHLNGVITINATEADDSHREAMRTRLGEAYRTMLGHFRHEIGHYYWQAVLAVDADRLATFRETFGDERQDYGAALQSHYSSDRDWRESFISQYATAHPWEDFAETFAHYLHIVDTLQSAATYGLVMAGPDPTVEWNHRQDLRAVPPLTAHGRGIDALLREWVPLSRVLNLTNRSMGSAPLYPFTIAPPVVEKLRYVDELVTAVAG